MKNKKLCRLWDDLIDISTNLQLTTFKDIGIYFIYLNRVFYFLISENIYTGCGIAASKYDISVIIEVIKKVIYENCNQLKTTYFNIIFKYTGCDILPG